MCACVQLQLPDADEKDIDERATWLETRDLEENFVDLVELALHEVKTTCSLLPIFARRGAARGSCLPLEFENDDVIRLFP